MYVLFIHNTYEYCTQGREEGGNLAALSHSRIAPHMILKI